MKEMSKLFAGDRQNRAQKNEEYFLFIQPPEEYDS